MANKTFEVTSKTYVTFPNDKYLDCCVISYQIADLPPGPLAQTNDPVPSARFLMGGFVTDKDTGEEVLARKWTNWLRISNNERSKLMQLFKGFNRFFDILNDDGDGGRLWTTPMIMQLEATKGDYQNIIRVKPGENLDVVANAFYDDSFVPYKVVKAFGKPVPLRLAACKFKDGVKAFTPETMADAPDENNR